MIDAHHGWNVSFKPQYIGFIVSLALVFAAYRLVASGHLSGWPLIYSIFTLGIMQALTQLVFFLHVGLDSKPHWHTITFLFAALIIFIVIGGSLWIMDNLDYNLMPTMEH